jgi:hypothetical protein
MPAPPNPSGAAAIRGQLVDTLRRDLIGPGPDDADIARERLKNNPSRWYLTGFLAPALDGASEGTEGIEDEGDPLFSEEPSDPERGTGAGGALPTMPRMMNPLLARAACPPPVASRFWSMLQSARSR